MEQSWAWSNSYPAGSPSRLPWPIPFDFSRSISAAWSQIGSWIDSFHPGTVNVGHTGAFALRPRFISGPGISSFLFPSPLDISPTEFLFLLQLRYLKQDKTFLLHCFYHSGNVTGAHLWFTPPERRLNCPWNLLSIVWFIYIMQRGPWAKL